MSSYDLEKVNTAIADTLSGNGSFDDLRRLQASKADIIDRMHFDSIQTIKDEIAALEAQRLTDSATEKELQSALSQAADELDKQASILQTARENHGTLNGLIFLKATALQVNRESINEKKAELSDLIKNKITEQI
jgi:protein-arginine kinase activator protein McsA